MSTTPSALSAGLQVLSNAGLLPTNLSTQQLENAAAGDLTQIAIGNIESSGLTTLLGYGYEPSSSGDTVNLSNAATSGITDPILQALETASTNASNASLGTNASTAPTSISESAALAAETQIGSLFSYLG